MGHSPFTPHVELRNRSPPYSLGTFSILGFGNIAKTFNNIIMKVKNISIINDNTIVINYTVEGKELAFYINNCTDVASAASAFIGLHNAGLL